MLRIHHSLLGVLGVLVVLARRQPCAAASRLSGHWHVPVSCGGRGATALPGGHAGRVPLPRARYVPLPDNSHELPRRPLKAAEFAVMEAGCYAVTLFS